MTIKEKTIHAMVVEDWLHILQVLTRSKTSLFNFMESILLYLKIELYSIFKSVMKNNSVKLFSNIYFMW